MKNVHAEIPGDYQFRAERSGPRLQRFWHRNKITVLRRLLPITPQSIVVDIGCGSGNLAADTSIKARQTIGLDSSLAAIRFARTRNDIFNGIFACATAEATPLPSAYIDVVLLVEVLEHLSRPEVALQEAARILRPGGRLFLTTPNYGFPSLWPVWEWLADHSRLTPRMEGAQHVQKFHSKSLERLVVQSGFHVERICTFYNLSPFFALVSASLALKFVEIEIAAKPGSGSIIGCVARKSSSAS